MPLYHLTGTSIEALDHTSFTLLRLLERSDLQRILRSKLDVIAPDCMLLTEEFCFWDDSRRRIDLLALDRDANLVVIELKRTDEGGHLELQALRYAAMVSTMTFEQAIEAYANYLQRLGSQEDARQVILDFLGWTESTDDVFARDVRLVLVSGDFSKEITSTVLWLNDRGLDIRCVRLRPYQFNDNVLIDVQPLIPLPEAAEYQVRVRERNEERRATAVIASQRDRTKFDITIGGLTQRQVNKRQAVLLVTRALAASGVTPEEMMHVLPERGDRLFIATEGELEPDAFMAQIENDRRRAGRTFDSRRWFCGPGELIHANGRTYAVSNQWGTNTDAALRKLIAGFPNAGVDFETAQV